MFGGDECFLELQKLKGPGFPLEALKCGLQGSVNPTYVGELCFQLGCNGLNQSEPNVRLNQFFDNDRCFSRFGINRFAVTDSQ